MVQELISSIFIIAGVLFILIASIGLLRLQDFYIRMSAITKAGTMGVGLIAAGIAIHFNDLEISIRAFVIISFMLLTSPVAAHIIARAAYKQGVPFWKKNLVDELDDMINRHNILEKIIVAEPNNIEVRIELVECHLALPSLFGGGFRRAILIASEIKELNAPEGHRIMGMIYALDRDFANAELEYKSAVEASGGDEKYKSELDEFYNFKKSVL